MKKNKANKILLGQMLCMLLVLGAAHDSQAGLRRWVKKQVNSVTKRVDRVTDTIKGVVEDPKKLALAIATSGASVSTEVIHKETKAIVKSQAFQDVVRAYQAVWSLGFSEMARQCDKEALDAEKRAEYDRMYTDAMAMVKKTEIEMKKKLLEQAAGSVKQLETYISIIDRGINEARLLESLIQNELNQAETQSSAMAETIARLKPRSQKYQAMTEALDRALASTQRISQDQKNSILELRKNLEDMKASNREIFAEIVAGMSMDPDSASLEKTKAVLASLILQLEHIKVHYGREHAKQADEANVLMELIQSADVRG